MRQYTDLLIDTKNNENRWRLIAMVLFILVIICGVGIVQLSVRFVQLHDRIQYIITPAAQTITTVRSGQLPKHFVARVFNDAVGLLNSWNYSTIEHQYQTLYKEYLSQELANRIKVNVENNKLISNAKSERLVSIWKPDYQSSKVKWCDKLQAPVGAHGLACGLIVGEQSLFADSVISTSKTEIAYLILAVNVAPNQFNSGKNLHGLEIIKIKRGPLPKLREELNRAKTEGKMPTEGGLYEQ